MPLRFLIADDNTAHQKLTANVILYLGGESVSVSNGAEAMERALHEDFDVIMLDLWMPECGGIVAATRLLREMEHSPHRPRIVAVTGDVSHERHTLCRAVGMDGFITKPCDLTHLRHKLKEVVMLGHCWPEGPAQPILDVERLWTTLHDGDAALVRDFNKAAAETRQTLESLPSLEEECLPPAIAVKDFAQRYGFIRLAKTMSGYIRAANDGEQQLFESQIRDEIRDFGNGIIAAHESLREAGGLMRVEDLVI